MKKAANLLAVTVCSCMLPALSGVAQEPEALLASPALVRGLATVHRAPRHPPAAVHERGTLEMSLVVLGLVAYQLRRRHRALQQLPRP